MKKKTVFFVLLGVLLLAAAALWLSGVLPGDAQPAPPSSEEVPSPGQEETPPVIPPEGDEEPEEPPEEDPETTPEDEPVPDDGLPHDQLFITVERQQYADGDLTLIVPRLSLDTPVLNGTGSSVLKRGVGLYDYAQLPGEGNRNVSIAGHRNGRRNGKVTDNAPFYYLHTLVQGDYLYLADGQSIYRYLYESTEIVEADDWGPIYSQGFSCLTLTSCEPIGSTDQRIIVRGRLDAVFDFDPNFSYLEHLPDEEVA